MNRKQILKDLEPALKIFQHVNDCYGLGFNEVTIVMDKGGSRVVIDTTIRGADKWDNVPFDLEGDNTDYKS